MTSQSKVRAIPAPQPIRATTLDAFDSPTRDDLTARGALKAPELHPTTRELMRKAARYGGLSDRVSVAYARRRMSAMMPLVASSPPVDSVADRTISGPRGSIPIRVVTPREGEAPRPAIVWFPGGGFVVGDLNTAEPTARNLAVRTGCVVVCVDYRKAPEHTLDDGYDDALAAVRWVFANATNLRVDPARIVVGGDSAGGNVAAVVAKEYAAEFPFDPLAAQVLVYPSVSVEHEPARARNADGSTLNGESMRWFETHVAGGIDPNSDRYSPLMAEDLSNLPPAVIVTAGYDPLRDEGIAYLDRLREFGVAAELLHYGDDVHGFFTMDLVLDNGVHALNATADLLGEILGLDVEVGTRPSGAARALTSSVAGRVRGMRVRVSYINERIMHTQIRYQRWLIRSMGLPSGRDVEAVNNRIKRLEMQVRTLRRQLEQSNSSK